MEDISQGDSLRDLICVSGLVLFNPFIEVEYIKVNPLAYLHNGQATGPDNLTEGRDRPPQVNGSLRNGKKPLFKGFPLGSMNPVRFYNFRFFQVNLSACALIVPVNKASAPL